MGSWQPMTVIAMSDSEVTRMNVLRDLAEDRLTAAEAATLMGVGRRQVFRLAKAYRQGGPQALVSRRRDQPSNRLSFPKIISGRICDAAQPRSELRQWRQI